MMTMRMIMIMTAKIMSGNINTNSDHNDINNNNNNGNNIDNNK